MGLVAGVEVDGIRQRMADERHIQADRLVQRRLEGIERQQPVRALANALRPPRPPGVHRGADIVDRRHASALQQAFQPQIELIEINAHEDRRRFGQELPPQAGQQPQQSRQLEDGVLEAVDGQPIHARQGRKAFGQHGFAADAGELQLRAGGAQRSHQPGAQPVPGCLSRQQADGRGHGPSVPTGAGRCPSRKREWIRRKPRPRGIPARCRSAGRRLAPRSARTDRPP